MYKITVYGLDMTISSNNIHIANSCCVTIPLVMDEILIVLRKEILDAHIAIKTPLDYRSNRSLINEWIAHNNLYVLGYKTDRVKDCDLNYPQKWYIKFGYWLLSRFIL